jgi:ATP-dependent helicase YprA (DUF1998 family)
VALLSEFYLSTPETAVHYDTTRDTFTGKRHKCERITDVELSILWSILRDEEWDSDLLDHFEMVFEAGGGERLIIQLPAEFIDTVVQLPVDLIAEAAEVWADTEELQCEPAEVQPVVEALATLGAHAKENNQNVYLWVCV